MRIYIGTDHGGYKLKQEVKLFIEGLGYEVVDKGAFELQGEDDYPDYVFPVAEHVSSEEGSLGIVIGRSGNGEAIAANKVRGVRAAVCLNSAMAEKAREHNSANILSLGADYIPREEVLEVVKTFLESKFSGEKRHKRRIEKISQYESLTN
ncbi:MAG: RpiB/LacA/LacB family sugar-phosphate isomerase [Patescibacteria group bacterium]